MFDGSTLGKTPTELYHFHCRMLSLCAQLGVSEPAFPLFTIFPGPLINLGTHTPPLVPASDNSRTFSTGFFDKRSQKHVIGHVELKRLAASSTQ